MKKLLCQVVNKNSGNGAAHCRNGAILQHIQDNVRKLIEQSCEMPPEEVMKLLNSVSANITKLQSPNPDADNINTAINNLKKHIKCLKPEAEITGCDLETQMKSILTTLQDIMKCDPPKSDRLDKIARNLKAICCNLKRQCNKGNKILSEIREVQDLFSRGEEAKKQSFRESTNMTSSLNENQNNVNAQFPVELQEIPEIKSLIAQIADEAKCLQQENNFGNCGLDDRISCLMEAIHGIQQSDCVFRDSTEKFLELLKNLEREICKQSQCGSESIAKINEILGKLKPDINQSSTAKTFNETLELILLPTQNPRYIRYIQPEANFESVDLLYILKYMQNIFQAGYGNHKSIGDIKSLLMNLGREIYKLEDSIQLHTSLEAAFASPQNRSSQLRVLQVDTNQSNDVEVETLNETQHLKCLVHHLKKFIKKYNSSCQFPECDFYSLMNFLLDTVIAITASNCLDDETKDQLLKIMRCLEAEFRLQGDMRCLNKKICQTKDNLADRVNADANECGGSSIDPAELIRCLVHNLKKIVSKARPSVQIQEGDQESQLSCLLSSLNEILQSGRIDQEAQGKLPKMMRCLKFSLSKLGKLTPALAAKIRDISQLLRSDGCQTCANLNQGQLRITGNLMSLSKQLRDILQTLMPNASIPECTSEAALNTLLDLLIQALRSGVCDNKKGIIKNILTGLQNEIASQISSLCSLQTKINTAIGMLKSESPTFKCSECSMKLVETPDLIAITSVMQRFLQRAKPSLQFQSCNLLLKLHSVLDNVPAITCAPCTVEITEALNCLLTALDKILCKQGQSELKEKLGKLVQTQSRRSDCSVEDPLKGSQICHLMQKLSDLVLLIYPDLVIPICKTEVKAMFFTAILKELAQRGSCDSDKTAQIRSLIPSIVCALQTAGADRELIKDFEELELMFPSRTVRSSQLARTSDTLNLRDLISKNISTMNNCIQQLENAMQKYGLD